MTAFSPYPVYRAADPISAAPSGIYFFESVVANGIGFDIRKINVFAEARTL